MLLVLGSAASLAALVLGGGENPDLVALQNGKELIGRIVYVGPDQLVLRQGARDVEIDRDDVARFDSVARNLDALLDNAARSAPTIADLELLASQARESRLAGEEEAFLWRILLLDSGHEDAHLRLGHRKRESAWVVPVGGSIVPFAQRIADARQWDHAWELTSLHYRVRSNLELAQNVDLLLDLERLYLYWFEWLAGDLRLLDVTRPMSVALHADAVSFPESGRQFGFFEPETDTVHIDASAGLHWETLAHEAAHQLLYDSIRGVTNRACVIPAWLDEGLAEYFATSLVRTAEGLTFTPGRPVERYFRTHAKAKKPLELERVLALTVYDFQDSEDRDLEYAQSYTLVHLLLEGEKGRYRPKFMELLRELYDGSGTAPDLKKTLRSSWRGLPSSWREHVRELAPP